MRLPPLDQALLAIWLIVGVPTIVLGWLHGVLLPPLWPSSPLLIEQLTQAGLALLVYGLPLAIIGRLALRALR